MASKLTYDTTNKLFKLNSGVTTLDAKTEFYSAAKQDWKDTDTLWRFRFPIASIGGQNLGGGVTVSPYYQLLYGWRIAPASADQSVVVVGNVITTEGDSPFGDTAGAYHHDFRSVVSGNSLTQTVSGGLVTADDVWDEAVEGTYTAREVLRIISAALAGELTGADTTTVTIRDLADSKDRITATVDSVGNRASVTVDAT